MAERILKAKGKKKMDAAEKNAVYYCDLCGCEVVCTTTGGGPLICCGEVMCCY